MSEAKITNELLLKMSETDRVKALELLSVLEKRKTQEEAQKNFIKFVDCMWEGFIHGRHFEIMANAFERIAKGELTRLIINMPPRHGKSEMASYLLPAWFLGLYPEKKIMQFSHSSELAETFGRKVRNLVDSDVYHEIFPETRLSKDSTAAARWNTNKGGEYHALGFGTNAAGKGSHLCLGLASCVETLYLGITKIGIVSVGDYIKTIYGWERITNKVLTTHNNYYRINSDLKASGEHPFLTRRGWVQAKDLQVGDKILIDSIWIKTWRTIKVTLRQTPHANRG